MDNGDLGTSQKWNIGELQLKTGPEPQEWYYQSAYKFAGCPEKNTYVVINKRIIGSR